MKPLLWLCACAALALAQPPSPLLETRDAVALDQRLVELAESTSSATPELARAAEPLLENARQAILNLRRWNENGDPTYRVLTNMRAFLVLADAVPKALPYAEPVNRQLAELRQGVMRLEAHFAALVQSKDKELRSPDRDELARYADANAKLPPPHAGNARVVFLGDSITAGWPLNEYFPGRDFVNRGISGQVTVEMLGRMKADVMDLHPDAVLLLGGTNDIERGTPLSSIENNIAMICDLADYAKIRVILASVTPVSDYHKDVSPKFERTAVQPLQTIRALNAWMKNFCAQRGYIYLDYYSKMIDSAGLLPADLAEDGLHPNGKGYRIMAPLAAAAIDQAVRVTPVPQHGRKHRAAPTQTGNNTGQ